MTDLRFWNQAPTNLKVLTDNGIVFALTTDKLKEDFRTNLLKAIKYGFDKTKALEALTTVPASLLGKSNEIGSLKNEIMLTLLSLQVRYSMRILKFMKIGFKVQNML
jgi:imidazolonepropionase-like amidohydrolase